MITVKTKGKKKIVSSSFFEDLAILKKSEYETDYRDIYQNSTFDGGALKRAYAVQKITLFKKGCWELTDWVAKQSNQQLDGITTQYFGKDYEEYVEKDIIFEEKFIADPENE